MKLKQRVEALESAGRDAYVTVPSPAGPHYDLGAMLEAKRCGRPFSNRPRTAFDDAIAAQRRSAEPTTPEDPFSPGAMLESRLEQLRAVLANEAAEPDDGDTVMLEQLRADTIKQIQRENRETERRERMRLKRLRKKERKRLAAVQDAAPDVAGGLMTRASRPRRMSVAGV